MSTHRGHSTLVAHSETEHLSWQGCPLIALIGFDWIGSPIVYTDSLKCIHNNHNIRVFPKYTKLAMLAFFALLRFGLKVRWNNQSFQYESRAHGKCHFALKVSQLSTISKKFYFNMPICGTT